MFSFCLLFVSIYQRREYFSLLKITLHYVYTWKLHCIMSTNENSLIMLWLCIVIICFNCIQNLLKCLCFLIYLRIVDWRSIAFPRYELLLFWFWNLWIFLRYSIFLLTSQPTKINYSMLANYYMLHQNINNVTLRVASEIQTCSRSSRIFSLHTCTSLC